jgi:hypothetical protein
VILSRAPLTRPKPGACDLHALGTPPAFVLSQDQTLRCVDWKATEVTSAPNGMDRVRVHHHDSVVKVQAAVERVTGE